MKAHDLLRSGAVLLAALLLVSGSALPAAAVEDTEQSAVEAEYSEEDADEDEDDEEEEEEYEVFTCGDYTYCRLVNDSDDDAACRIEKYYGTEKELVIPAELDGLPVVQFGDYAFVNATSLEKVTLPKTLTQLGKYNFANCVNITAYEVEDGNENFESRDGVLYSTDGLAMLRYPLGTNPTDVTIEEGIEEIGDVAFTCCESLKSVKLPTSLLKIGEAAFSNCPLLTEIIIPENVYLIGPFAFNSCTSLAKAELPESLLEIGNGAFAATAIESVTLPKNITTIGEQAFAATKMKEVTVPDSVTDIGYTAFGWLLNEETGEMYADKEFVIYGALGSAAQSYANDSYAENNFQFVVVESEDSAEDTESEDAESAVDTPQAEENSEAETTDTETDSDTGMSSGRIIGIAVCGVLLVVIVVAAVISAKKPKKGDSGDA